MKNIILRNGLTIPQIGLGTWQITDREVMRTVISDAFELGYRLIDTAAAYSNEIAIAKAIEAAHIMREELLLSDKAWNTSRGYLEVQEACKRSLKKMKTDYFDLYMLHWPASPKLYPDWTTINAETWRGMEALYREGVVKAIGVCNFKVHHLEELEKTAEIMPFINQIELHPGLYPWKIIEYCKEKEIKVEASSPLGNGQILSNFELVAIAEKYQKTAAQICIRWAMQKDVIAIPKSTRRERLRDNIEVFDFELTKEEMEMIDAIPYCGGIGIDSDEVVEFG